ncbi:MAG: hypothetical protein WC822_01400 [Candidatus Paceibacterota bacterium]|jgi:hypothetical protein
MAQFYARAQGDRGEVTRRGTKTSGMYVSAGSWSGGASIRLYYDAKTDRDMMCISIIPWGGHGTTRLLYDGPCDGKVQTELASVMQGGEEEG